jgi:uncharacterized DUF497 family protein
VRKFVAALDDIFAVRMRKPAVGRSDTRAYVRIARNGKRAESLCKCRHICGIASQYFLEIVDRRSACEPEYNCPYDPGMKINWDPAKTAANVAAHGVSFAEAATVLADERARTREDSDAIGERRFATLGLSGEGGLLAVIDTYRDSDGIRIVSAWQAKTRQSVRYEKSRG